MGVYYKWVCVARNEYISPMCFGDDNNPRGAGIKKGPITLGRLSNIVTNYLVVGGWTGYQVRLVPDHDDLYERARETFTDVTEHAVDHFVQQWPEFAEAWRIKYLPGNRG